jgi:hypothetical protein
MFRFSEPFISATIEKAYDLAGDHPAFQREIRSRLAKRGQTR